MDDRKGCIWGSIYILIIAAVFLLGIFEDINIKDWSIFDGIKEEAYQAGYNAGQADGFAAGEETGYDKGYDKGYSKGYLEGHEKGKNDGYKEGYSKGVEDTKDNSGPKITISGMTNSSGASSDSGKNNNTNGSSGGNGGGTKNYGEAEEICEYVLNKNTKKFHYTWCSSVSQMKQSNREYYSGTRENVIARGFSPCGRCNP